MRAETNENRRGAERGAGICAVPAQGARRGGAVRIPGTVVASAALHRAIERGSAKRTYSEIGIRRRIFPVPQPGGQRAANKSARWDRDPQRSGLPDYK